MNVEELLQILACPRCMGDLTALRRGEAAAAKQLPDGDSISDVAGFACKACKVVYPVRDDIPVMLVEEAIPNSTWNRDNPDCPAA